MCDGMLLLSQTLASDYVRTKGPDLSSLDLRCVLSGSIALMPHYLLAVTVLQFFLVYSTLSTLSNEIEYNICHRNREIFKVFFFPPLTDFEKSIKFCQIDL